MSKVKIPAGLSRDVEVMIEYFDEKLTFVTEQIVDIKKDVDELKSDMNIVKEDVEVIKTDIEFIKDGLRKKVDYNEFASLERRVALLESRR